MATLWGLKMFGTMLWIPSFFYLYFWVMRHPIAAPMLMPLTPIDRWLPVSERALGWYGSLWLYVGLAPAIARDRGALFAYAWGAAFLSVGGLLFFWLVPTALPPLPIDWARYPMLLFLKHSDVAGNAFPSLHVAFAVFTGVMIARPLRAVGAPAWIRIVNGGWSVGIIYSTLATRQHVFVDVLGGIAVAACACAVTWALTPGERALNEAPVSSA